MKAPAKPVAVPHGGELVDRRAPKDERSDRLSAAENLAKLTLGPRTLSDLEMISTGVFSPLTGFMVRDDYESVVENMRLANGLVWSLPVTLSASEDEVSSVNVGDEVALTDSDGRIVATMTVEDLYSYDKEREAREVYRTTEEAHPGVAALYAQGDTLVGGEVTLLGGRAEPAAVPRLLLRAGGVTGALRGKGLATGRRLPDPQPGPSGRTSTSRRAL